MFIVHPERKPKGLFRKQKAHRLFQPQNTATHYLWGRFGKMCKDRYTEEICRQMGIFGRFWPTSCELLWMSHRSKSKIFGFCYQSLKPHNQTFFPICIQFFVRKLNLIQPGYKLEIQRLCIQRWHFQSWSCNYFNLELVHLLLLHHTITNVLLG